MSMHETVLLDEVNPFNQNYFIIKLILKEQGMGLYHNIIDIRKFKDIYYLLENTLETKYNGYAFLDAPNGTCGKIPILNSFILYSYTPYELSINIIVFAFNDPIRGKILLDVLMENLTDRKIKIYATFHTDEVDAIKLCINNGFIVNNITTNNSFEYTSLEFS